MLTKSEIRISKQYLMTEIQMSKIICFKNWNIGILNLFRASDLGFRILGTKLKYYES